MALVTESFSTVVEPGFSESVFFASAGRLQRVTCFGWSPDASGRLFVGSKDGSIRILKGGVLQEVPFLTVAPVVHQAWECGLTGFCFDPNFMKNGYIYVLVTASATEQKILRYEAKGDFASNKVELIRGLPTSGNDHNGGALVVGSDGKLYWGIGDCSVPLGADADLSSLASKIGRANLDGTIPPDNPFADGPGRNNDYIWARGCRNPFKAAIQPNTGALWVNVTGAFYEQIFCFQKGDHAGWVAYENVQLEGYCRPKIKYATGRAETFPFAGSVPAKRTNNVATFRTSTPHGFCEGEKLQIQSVNNASFNGSFYVASILTPTDFTVNQPGTNAVGWYGSASTVDMGRAVTGGTFYNATGIPAAYRNNFFFGDYVSSKIYRARIDSINRVLSVDLFATGAYAPVDMAVGPDGALYYTGHGGDILRTTYASTAQNLVVSPGYLNMSEGGTGVFHVRLAIAPPSNVIVGIGKANGSAGIVSSTTSLIFTPGNFNVPQPVFVSAQSDSNATGSAAQFSLSSSGLATEIVSVNAYDCDVSGIRISGLASIGGKAQLNVSGPAGVNLVLESSTNLGNWTPFSTNFATTNSLRVLDNGSSNVSMRYYRAVNRP